MKIFILSLLIFLNSYGVFGQIMNIRYFIETLPDNSKRVIYSFNTVIAERDTSVDIKGIKVFLLENPSYMMPSTIDTGSDSKKYMKIRKERRKQIAMLKNMEELILYGNDTDTFAKKTKGDFKFLTKSSKLKIVRFINIGQSSLFEKYIAKKYEKLHMLQGMAGT